MKILFLDIDGVLNNQALFKKNHEEYNRSGKFEPYPVDFDSIAELNRVLDETGAFIVLSSSWRGVEELEDRLAEVGVLNRCHPHYRTPRHGSPDKPYVNRGTEIKDWLDNHPEVGTFAIVDDDSDMLEEQMPYFVQTSFEFGGLSTEKADRLISVLGKL